MIGIEDLDFTSQAGMEQALRAFTHFLVSAKPDTISSTLRCDLVSCDYERKTAVFSCKLENWMSNQNGFAHGGITSGIMDICLGTLCHFYSRGQNSPTTSLTTSFLRPVPVDGVLLVEAECTFVGRTSIQAMGKAWMAGEPERLVLTGTGAYHPIPLDKQR